jgi:glycosyltransferase involved in cell wall biosynthesis
VAPLTIALVAIDDPTSPSAWSGIPAGMLSGFTEVGARVVTVGVFRQGLALPFRIAGRVRNTLWRDTYRCEREPALLSSYARQVAKAINGLDVALVVAPGSIPVSALKVRPPIVIWADATVGAMVGYYDEFSDWSPRTTKNAVRAERAAVSRTDLFVAASEWAASSARAEYGLPEERTAVVPFGANIENVPAIQRRSPGHEVRLLSVGVDWVRKGVDVAVGAATELRRAGVPARLDVVGCEPPDGITLPPFVTVHGFVSKASSEGRRQLDELYRSAHVFILPSRAECFGVVFCEAAAYGLPVIARRTGGIPTAVLHGSTGLLIDPAEGATAYAEAVQQLLCRSDLYALLARRSRERYERELSWGRAAAHVLDLVDRRIWSSAGMGCR